MVALSVSTSASNSPFFTGSPTFLCQAAITPSVMVSLNRGIKITSAITHCLVWIENCAGGGRWPAPMKSSREIKTFWFIPADKLPCVLGNFHVPRAFQDAPVLQFSFEGPPHRAEKHEPGQPAPDQPLRDQPDQPV